MKENKSVGPNLKTYYYYTNEMADNKNAKAIFVIATGMEGTGALYDEVGAHLDSLGYAMYAIDEWGYGKTGEVTKEVTKNWGRKGFHYAAYNVHALSVLAKAAHPDVPVYLIGNDFGAMLSIYLLKQFPEIVDKLVTIGWGAPRGQDFGFAFTSFLKKIALYDNSVSKLTHKSQNKRFSFRFERNEKFAWLSSDLNQVQKIKEAGFVDKPGTVGHYYHYFTKKLKTPVFMRIKKMDRNTPMLLLSGDEDLFTKKGLTTKTLSGYFKMRRFNNVECQIVPGRHQLLFEQNRIEVLNKIVSWCTGVEGVVEKVDDLNVDLEIETNTRVIDSSLEVSQSVDVIDVIDVPMEENTANEGSVNPEKPIEEFLEADENLRINTNIEEK